MIRERTQRMLDQFGGQGHIANLGHGILPDVPVSHAQAFIDAVREWRRR
jgi:uroporphyrinogen decarboxylase